MTDELLIRYIAKAIEVAQANLGVGEDSRLGNNEGRFLELIGGRAGAEWCALWSGYPYRLALRNAALDSRSSRVRFGTTVSGFGRRGISSPPPPGRRTSRRSGRSWSSR